MLAKISEEKRVYIDESGINKPIVREHGRSLRGMKIEDTKRGRKFQRTNIVAAKISDKIVAPLCYTENTTSASFVKWLRTSFIKSVPKDITAIMDNASFHPLKRSCVIWLAITE